MTSSTASEPGVRERVVGHGHARFDWVRARVTAMTALSHAALDVPSRVTMLPGEAVAVAEPGRDAPTLQTVLDDRGSLKAGECVWVGMAIAESLAVLHRAGLAHGAVTAESVRLPASGVLLGGLVDGETDAAASDDVAALGRLLASCVTGPEAERVRAWTEPMTHPDPAARPTAAMVARALGSCARPEPIRHVPRGVASSMRSVASEHAEVRRLPGTRWWRVRRFARAWALRGAIAAVATVLVAAGVHAVVADPGSPSASPVRAANLTRAPDGSVATDPSGPADPSGAADPATDSQDPAWAARQATEARFDALRSADGHALVQWTAPGSPARAEAETTAAALSTGRMVVDGLTASVLGVEPVEPAVEGGDVAVMRVTYTLSDHTVTIDGEVQRFEGYTQTVDLELVRDSTRWWVRSATEATPAGV